MHISTYHDIIIKTVNSDVSGYGYVKEFTNAIYSHREELNISNAFLYLRVGVNGIYKEWLNFADNRKINTESFKLINLSKENRVIDSRLENISSFKNTNEFGNFHVIAFPIHPNPTREKLMEMEGVVILLSFQTIKLSNEETSLLYEFLCTRRPKTIGCPQVSKAIKHLIGTLGKMSDISLKDRHVILAEALNILAAKGDNKANENGLRHFSFWSSNNIEKRNLCKEFNKNTYDDFCHDITYKILDGQRHFVADYFNYYKENENSDFREVIKLYNYEDIEGSLNNSDEYFPKIGLTRENTSVVIIPLKFDPHISFCCFYIKDLIFTPFVSITLFKKLGDAIRQRINLVNEINIKNMLDSMMEASFKYKKSTDFFKAVTSILKKSNEAEDCLIYLRDDADERFLLASEEDENNTSTIKDENLNYIDHGFFLPGKYFNSNFIRKNLYQALQTRVSVCSYPDTNESITSVCVIIIKDAAEHLCGFILLVNKYHETKNPGLFFNNLFFFNNIYITESCSKYITLYLDALHSNNRKIKLLKKLRHEIPDCTHVIEKNIIEMMPRIDDRGYRKTRFPQRAKQILMNSRRVYNIAAFFSTIDFDDNRFLEYPEKFNMRDYMNERLDIFREEALYRGVYIRCNTELDTPTIMVSNFYLHAITNIITNAIRYAAPGTCIWIRSNSDEISISDVGIGIKDSELFNIFKEGFRSTEAKSINQRGMGYGLYLVKRILDAYGHPIDVKSEKVHNRNVYAERMVSKIISEFPQEERLGYVLNETFPYEENEVWRRVNSIKTSESQILPQYRSFINNDEVSTSYWFNYHRKFGPSFFVMEDDYFNHSVYNVTFTIKYPK